MCQDVCIEINEVVENISIEVRDFSVSNIIGQDDGNAVVVGEDGLLFVPENESIGTVTSVNSILPDVNGNVVVPIPTLTSDLTNDSGFITASDLPTVPDFATELEVNAGVVSNKTIAPNTLASWWVYQKGLIQTFAQKITFSLGALFTPQTTPTHERGRVYFDDVNDCLAYMDSISGTSVQIGQEMIMRVRNNTGATILNGAVVYVSGSIGQNSTIALAQANAMPTSEIIGIATHDIPNNTIGKVCVFGQVNDLDTSAFSDGNAVFLSSSVAGGLVLTPPISPNFVVAVGVVEHAHPTQGKILVRPQRALANNNSLGTSQSVSATQNAVKTYTDTKLSNDISTYTPATTPLTGTEKALIHDGIDFKEVAVSEFVGDLQSVTDNGNSTTNTIITPIVKLPKGSFNVEIFPVDLTANRKLEAPDKNGIIATMGDIPSNPITGTGTINRISKFTSSGVVGDSQIYDNGTNVGIGTTLTTPPQARLDVRAQGALSTDIAFRVRNSTDTANLLSLNGLGATTITQHGNTTLHLRNTSLQDTGGPDGTIIAQVMGGFSENSVSYGGMRLLTDTSWLSSQLGFFTGGYSGNPVQRMVIKNNGNVGINTSTPVASAQLQVDSTTRGFLPPRMTTTQRNAIASPAAGLIVYDTTENKHYGFNGTTWNALY